MTTPEEDASRTTSGCSAARAAASTSRSLLSRSLEGIDLPTSRATPRRASSRLCQASNLLGSAATARRSASAAPAKSPCSSRAVPRLYQRGESEAGRICELCEGLFPCRLALVRLRRGQAKPEHVVTRPEGSSLGVRSPSLFPVPTRRRARGSVLEHGCRAGHHPLPDRGCVYRRWGGPERHRQQQREEGGAAPGPEQKRPGARRLRPPEGTARCGRERSAAR